MKLGAAGRRDVLTAAIAGVGTALQPGLSRAAASAEADNEARIRAMTPELEAVIGRGMKAYDVPALAIGIVARDRLAYARGFGVRSRQSGGQVGTRTVFQIGSATKGFLATTLALMVERGRLRWDDRIVDLDPGFALADPWVTREFRVFDLLAQRSGLPPYANDALGIMGLDETALIRSLRYVEPVSSFRSTFAYTNVTHMLAGRIVAKAAGAADWNAVLQAELLGPLGMAQSTTTAAAIEGAPDHAEGYRWAPSGSVEVPFTQIFPYDFGGAGDINSTVEDMANWLRLQLGRGSVAGHRLVSAESLAATHTPKVAVSATQSYALGWVVRQTPNGTVIWHNGGTSAFGSYVGFAPDHDAGVVVLTNATNVGLPDAIGAWTMDRLLGNPDVDYVTMVLKQAVAGFERDAALFTRPTTPRPAPPLARLAGRFDNPGIGRADVAVEGAGLVMTLAACGARLAFDPWDGGVFTVRLLGDGRFAAIAANLGPQPSGFAQFQIGKDGRLDRLLLSMSDGQAYPFQRTALSRG